MATIKFGAPVVAVRGKAGGVVFSRARGGFTLQTRSSRVNKTSPVQSAVRNQTNVLMKRFRFTLSASQREKWSFFSSNIKNTNVFGDVISSSPINLYVKCNTIRHHAWQAFPGDAIFNGLEFLDDPPLDSLVDDFDLSIIGIHLRPPVAGFSNIAYQINNFFFLPDHVLCMQCTGPLRGGISNFKKKFRFLTYFTTFILGPQFPEEDGNFGRKWGNQSVGTLIAGRLVLLNVTNGFSRIGPSIKLPLI